MRAQAPRPRVVPAEETPSLRDLRRRIIAAAAGAGEGHIPSAFSILDILWVLYRHVLAIDPRDPRADARDRFILSKGHGSLALYAVLAATGFFPMATLDSFARFESSLGGHPDCNKVPGVEASTGSLGHGFPIAVGIAMGLRIRRLPARTFCLIGDGEANEGSVWEAAMLAAHHRLSNLCCIVDNNRSSERALALGDIAAKFAAFGWAVREVDGHDHEAIFAALAEDCGDRPRAVVARTVKGHGCAVLENAPAWHHRAPNEAELAALLSALA